jgi:hypothetical protein
VADRVKWRSDLRGWVADPTGVNEYEARGHGFIGLTRRDQLLHVVLDDDPVPDVVLTRRDARLMVAFLKRLSARLAERRSAREARIAEKAALRAERQAVARAAVRSILRPGTRSIGWLLRHGGGRSGRARERPSIRRVVRRPSSQRCEDDWQG